jgi:oligopeptide transport system substrate-binding protein
VNYYAGRDVGGYTTRGKIANLLVAQWRQAFPGWTVQLDDGRHLQVCQEKPHQLDNASWLAEYPDPQDFLSKLWTTRGYYNGGFISTPQVDALCAQADGMSDLSARIPLYQQAEQLLATQSAAIPYAQPLQTYVMRSRVVGWGSHPLW